MGQNRENEQMAALGEFIDSGLIDDVLGIVKSGKEATVYCCTDGHDTSRLLAAKVYRSRNVRGFSNDAQYQGGRLRGTETRYARAIETKSRKGREFAFDAWVAEEYATLSLLHRAGAAVPAPIAQSSSVIIMEYIGDEDEPAPPLNSVRLDAAHAPGVFDDLMRNVELALANDRIHGDLSAFNVLYWDGAIRIIDFPQAVDPRFNANAQALLQRDIDNLCGHFERYGICPDGRRIATNLWNRFIRSEL